MSFTEAGFKRIIAGEFADGFVTGQFGFQLIEIEFGKALIQYFISSLENGEVIFEYDPIPLIPGQHVDLAGAEIKIPLEIVKE